MAFFRIFSSILLVFYYASIEVNTLDICQQQERCDQCIQTTNCMWCSNPKKDNDEDEVAHCQSTSVNLEDFCDPGHLENPENMHRVTEDVPLSNVDGEKSSTPDEKIIQLAPQRIKMKLRKGVPEKVRVTYRQAQDYPVDLYYLMDLSETMSDDKKNLATLGGKLTKTLQSLTDLFTIGFGSYVDKPIMPFAETSPNRIDEPCEDCVRPYAFRNHLPLGNDSDMFTKRVEEARISGNLDTPEGGLDALMQAMVCKEAIGWRNQSRKIIIFSTDDRFHHAGDGRLAGVVAPNDERCHLNEDHEYDQFDKYDYPSIAQINKIAVQENINIIFAVTASHEDLYRDVSKMIKTSSYGIMNFDSSNVVELVVKQYEQISSIVRLSDNSTDSPVSIHYTSSCLENGSDPIDTQECSRIGQGQEVSFDLEVVANECSEEKVILEVKSLQDTLVLEIDLHCNCNCEKQGRHGNSSVCSHQGDLVCGVCDCFTGYQEKNCMCSVSDFYDGSPSDETFCKAPGDDKVCSGQGTCRCGKCACRSEEITGHYCQCNSQKCISDTDEVCSGHGTCDCDRCVCDPGYEDKFCQCPTEETCIEPGTKGNEVCSGEGTCECGECRCNATFSGRYCEDCLICKRAKCREFRDSVHCLFNTPPCDSDMNTTPVDSLASHISKGAQECKFLDETDGCVFKFAYLYGGHDLGYNIHVLKNKVCPEEAPILGIMFGLVAAIVGIGLLTLAIWKCVTSHNDRKEYQCFKEECQKGTWSDENQLYLEPSQTTENPTYSQNA